MRNTKTIARMALTHQTQFFLYSRPQANPTYAELAAHYQTAIVPARPRMPQDKSIAENAVLVASRWIIACLAKQKFYSLNALNNALFELLTVLNQKLFQKRQGSRYQQFIAHEKTTLRLLPQTDYVFAALKYQTVPKDYHVRLEGHYYSVPYTLVGETVFCRITPNTVEIFQGHQRRASHVRSRLKDKKTTNDEHMPKAHCLYQNWTPQAFLDWAAAKGPGA